MQARKANPDHARKADGPQWKRILADEDVARWHADLANGSRETAKEYARVLHRLTAEMKLTPAQFIALGQERAENAVLDYVNRAVSGKGRKAPLAGKTVEYHKAVLLSWMKFRRMPCRIDIKVPKTVRYNPRNEDTKIPGRDDLRRLLTGADPRTAIVIAAMAYSALRPRVLADREQMDGLRFADLPESRFVDGKILFDKVPTVVKIRANLSKNKKAYTTFFPRETCAYIEADVARRLADGEKLTKHSLVVAPYGEHAYRVAGKDNPDGVLTKVGLYKIGARAMKNAGIKAHPYIWKSYCSDRLAHGESDGLTTKFRVYLMGHSGSVTDDYSTRKAELTPETLEKMRAAYEVVARKHLEAFPVVSVEDDRLAQVRVLLSAIGVPIDQVNAVDRMDQTDLVKLVQNRLVMPPQPISVPAFPTLVRGRKQHIVRPGDADQADMLLDQGWLVKQELKDGRLVLEQPEGDHQE